MKRHVCKWVSEWVTRARGYVAHCRYCGRPYPRKRCKHLLNGAPDCVFCHRDQLKHELSLAEEGLANYAQELQNAKHDIERLTAAASAEATDVERISTLLGMVAVHLKHPELGGLSEDQQLAISEWHEVFRERRVGVPQSGSQT